VKAYVDAHCPSVFFAIGFFGEKVHLIARSYEEGLVVVGRMCEHFGGGVHAGAAAATIKDATAEQVQEQLLSYLRAFIPSPTMSAS